MHCFDYLSSAQNTLTACLSAVSSPVKCPTNPLLPSWCLHHHTAPAECTPCQVHLPHSCPEHSGELQSAFEDRAVGAAGAMQVNATSKSQSARYASVLTPENSSLGCPVSLQLLCKAMLCTLTGRVLSSHMFCLQTSTQAVAPPGLSRSQMVIDLSDGHSLQNLQKHSKQVPQIY